MQLQDLKDWRSSVPDLFARISLKTNYLTNSGIFVVNNKKTRFWVGGKGLKMATKQQIQPFMHLYSQILSWAEWVWWFYEYLSLSACFSPLPHAHACMIWSVEVFLAKLSFVLEKRKGGVPPSGGKSDAICARGFFRPRTQSESCSAPRQACFYLFK